jgi:hypothetical protein
MAIATRAPLRIFSARPAVLPRVHKVPLNQKLKFVSKFDFGSQLLCFSLNCAGFWVSLSDHFSV